MKQQNYDIGSQLRLIVGRHTDGVINMTPSIAKRILDECSFTGQRPIRISRVEKIKRLIQTSDWRGDIHPITIVIATDTGRPSLVNGHHRVTAISESDRHVPIKVILEEASGESEVRLIYSQFDDPDSSRTLGEVLDAEQMPLILGIGKEWTTRLHKAVSMIRAGFDVNGKSSQSEVIAIARDRIEVMREMGEWKEEAHRFIRCVRSAQPAVQRNLKTAGVMAVAIYVMKHQPERGFEFWMGLAKNNGLRRTDPRSTLIDDMSNRSRNSGLRKQIFMPTALAWNAWFDGRELKIIKVSADTVFKLLGTPMSAGQISTT